MGLPEPLGSDRDAELSVAIKATVVAAEANLPTVALARFFHIDPLLRWSGGGPQWSWPLPWPYAREGLAAELAQAHHALDRQGYCGPDDRGAYFRSVLCLAWRDNDEKFYSGRVEGQFVGWNSLRIPQNMLEDAFVPDGETATLARLPGGRRALHSDQERALEAFRAAFIG